MEGKRQKSYHIFSTRRSCTGQAQCEVSAYAPIDAALRRIIERADKAVTNLQLSPLIVNGFKNGFHNGFSIFSGGSGA